jgi:hypothetical protein
MILSRVERDNEFRERVCRWLLANGVDPRRTPVDPEIRLDNHQLSVLQKTQAPRGGDIVAPDGVNVLKHRITVPLVVTPDADIEEWLNDA